MNTDLDGFNGDPELGKQKEASDSLNLTNEIIISWLGKGELFQTFDEEVKCDINEIKHLLDEEENDEEQSSC
jgi:hypothetical protein